MYLLPCDICYTDGKSFLSFVFLPFFLFHSLRKISKCCCGHRLYLFCSKWDYDCSKQSSTITPIVLGWLQKSQRWISENSIYLQTVRQETGLCEGLCKVQNKNIQFHFLDTLYFFHFLTLSLALIMRQNVGQGFK